MGMFDTFIGEVICPICNEVHSFEEQTKLYECTLSNLMLGDYVDKGNTNYIYDFDWYCEQDNSPYKIGIVVRKGQIVKFISTTDPNKDIDNINIESLENIEEGLGIKLLYEKTCIKADGYPKEKLDYTLNPLSTGYKFVAFNVEWEVIKLYRQKEHFLFKDMEYYYEIKSKEHGVRILYCSKRLWKTGLHILTIEHANQYRNLFFD